jgi:hypothetical protein
MSLRINDSAAELSRLREQALERGLHLRDNRATTLDGSGYTLRPLKLGQGGRLRHFDDLKAVAAALAEMAPVDQAPDAAAPAGNPCSEVSLPGLGITSQFPADMGAGAAPWPMKMTATKKERPDPQVLRSVSDGIHPVSNGDYITRRLRP